MRSRRKPKLTEELSYQAHDHKRRGWTRRQMATKFGVAEGTIQRALAMPLTRPLPPLHGAKKAAPAPVVAQSAADAAKLVELLSEPECVLDRILREQAEALVDPRVDAERARLHKELCSVDSPEAAAEIHRALAMLDPVVRHYSAAGDTLVMALDLAGQTPLALATPRDLRDLALAVRDDDREAAAELLAAAHELVTENKS